ncbi:MAG: SPFH domain-containing protein [Firmicutes bacterium]|nr:SPFH domain-containing protein [Bacillota bacterium]
MSEHIIKNIEWAGNRADLIAYKFPMDSRSEIMTGAPLFVPEGAIAIFTKDKQIADTFTHGKYQLDAKTLPRLSTMTDIGVSFKCDIWFINTSVVLGQKWATAVPFIMQDSEFGEIRIRAYGTFNFSITNSTLLVEKLLDPSTGFTVQNIKDKLRYLITTNLGLIIRDSNYSAIDLATKLREFSGIAREALQECFNLKGFELVQIIIESFSFPEEVEHAINDRITSGILSKVESTILQPPASPKVTVQDILIQTSPSTQIQQIKDSKPNACITERTKSCLKCNTQIPYLTKFCADCGGKQAELKICPECRVKIRKGQKFCSECGERLQ